MPHIIELLGKTRVVIKDGKVIEVGQSVVEWCPIFAKVHGIQRITPEEVKKNIATMVKAMNEIKIIERFFHLWIIRFSR